MKCPNCYIEMVEVLSWIEHPGPVGRMTGHPGPPLYYRCKQCGTKIESKSAGQGESKREKNDSRERR